MCLPYVVLHIVHAYAFSLIVYHHIICISSAYHLGHDYRHICISSAYHLHIMCIYLLYHLHIICISSAYHQSSVRLRNTTASLVISKIRTSATISFVMNFLQIRQWWSKMVRSTGTKLKRVQLWTSECLFCESVSQMFGINSENNSFEWFWYLRFSASTSESKRVLSSALLGRLDVENQLCYPPFWVKLRKWVEMWWLMWVTVL